MTILSTLKTFDLRNDEVILARFNRGINYVTEKKLFVSPPCASCPSRVDLDHKAI
jgi:hypothetical protein